MHLSVPPALINTLFQSDVVYVFNRPHTAIPIVLAPQHSKIGVFVLANSLWASALSTSKQIFVCIVVCRGRTRRSIDRAGARLDSLFNHPFAGCGGFAEFLWTYDCHKSINDRRN
jgi:hypothetical protein